MAEIRDVTLRDGLQLTGKPLSVERKVELIRILLGLGVPSLEIGSLARPDLLPTMANTLDVVALLEREELARCWLWVATPRHVQRAVAAGAVNVQYCLSVSDAHNNANIGRDTDVSLASMPMAIETTLAAGGRLQLCLATAFSCPFEGPVDPHRVIDLANDPRTEGAADIVLCDTLGRAIPSQVAELVSLVGRRTPPRFADSAARSHSSDHRWIAWGGTGRQLGGPVGHSPLSAAAVPGPLSEGSTKFRRMARWAAWVRSSRSISWRYTPRIHPRASLTSVRSSPRLRARSNRGRQASRMIWNTGGRGRP